MQNKKNEEIVVERTNVNGVGEKSENILENVNVKKINSKNLQTLKCLQKNHFVYISLHYTLCPVETREVWAKYFSVNENKKEFASMLAQALGFQGIEMIFISTCNRFDVAIAAERNPKEANQQEKSLLPSPSESSKVFVECLEKHFISLFSNVYVCSTSASQSFEMRNILLFDWNLNGFLKLSRVAASLDSLVVGEPHILGQIKEAYAASLKLGICKHMLRSPFDFAFSVSKKVRSLTEIGKSGVSIGHAAVELTKRIYDNFSNVSVLIIGAGEMARVTSQHFLSRGLSLLTISSRTLKSANLLRQILIENLAEFEDQELKIKACTYEDAILNLAQYHIVIAATASQNFLLLPKHREFLKRRKMPLPLVVVDISVPRNVDPLFVEDSDTLLFDVDDLEKVMESGKKIRQNAVFHAENIVKEELSQLKAALTYSLEEAHVRGAISKLHAFTFQTSLQNIEVSKFKRIEANSVAKKTVAPFVELLCNAGAEIALQKLKLEHPHLFESENNYA